jgi:PhnB protein
MKVDPYLNFEGRCDEAIAFYESAVGAKVNMLLRFRDCPDCQPAGKEFPPELMEKVMHASLLFGDTDVMATDGRNTGKTNFAGVSLSVRVATEAEADKVFTALSDGGKVTMPIGKTFFSPRFGMVTDRFGVSWMVVAQH